ncbi:hypothetical protein ACFVGY_14535 [Streptomyces sp. NPDC127106]|uniref:hypothetical protein n=1 Tax=Streptomyces sp. NPDC127106 TaxID=3345360 RepID=UPI003636BAAD
MELRHSARCSAAWARVERANDSWRSKIEIRWPRGGSRSRPPTKTSGAYRSSLRRP